MTRTILTALVLAAILATVMIALDPAASQNQIAQPGLDAQGWSVVGWLVGLVLVIVLVIQLLRSTAGRVILGMGVLLCILFVAFWALYYRGGDITTTQGRDQNLQIQKIIQPNGMDPERDKEYTAINRGGQVTSLLTAVSFSVYAFWIIVFVVVSAFLAVLFKSRFG